MQVDLPVNLGKYRTFIFDCDGVLLNSNKLKSAAFYTLALPFGEKHAKEFERYHLENGGLSRFKKFEYLLKIIGRPQDEELLKSLLHDYASLIKDGLLICEIGKGLFQLKELTIGRKWMVVSGGYQKEIRDLFKIRQLESLFDGGIYGSPTLKCEILKGLCDLNKIEFPALFFGDSKLDYFSANEMNIDFIFMSAWTELNDWREFCEEYSLRHCLNFREICSNYT